MRIKVCPDGSLEMLYTDAIDIRAIGWVTVRRASQVEYDHARGGWTVEFVSGGWLGRGEALVEDSAAAEGFAARSAALAAEVSYLEARL